MHVASHLDDATAKAAANRQIAALSSAFAVAAREGRTEIHNGSGQPYTQSGFQSLWQRTVKKSGVADVHFHDLRARAVTDNECKQRGSGSDMAGHVDPKTTRKIYRRGAVKVSPVR
jgi:integrase